MDLVDEIRSYLKTLPSHVAERKMAKLLKRAADKIRELEDEIDEINSTYRHEYD